MTIIKLHRWQEQHDIWHWEGWICVTQSHFSSNTQNVKSKIFIFDAVIRIPISSYFVLSDNNCNSMSRNSNLLSIKHTNIWHWIRINDIKEVIILNLYLHSFKTLLLIEYICIPIYLLCYSLNLNWSSFNMNENELPMNEKNE